ncbi:MAG: tyrosine-type recombinase/integrase [Actinomycetota bacterium]
MARRRQFGSVRRIDGGRWQARYLDPLTGRRVPAPRTFTTKKEASRWLAGLEAGGRGAGNGTTLRSDVGDDVLLREYAAKWLSERSLKPRTRETYEGQYRLHIDPHLGDARPGRLRPEHIRTWHAALRSTTLSPVTVAKVYRLLRTMLATAVEDGLIESNPCKIQGAGVERSAERSIPDLPTVIAIAEAMPPHLQATVWIAAFAGLRKGEILGLARRHVDLGSQLIKVERALQEITGEGAVMVTPKTDSSVREVVVPRTLVGRLAVHLQEHVDNEADALLFTNSYGHPIRATVWTKAYNGARTAAGAESTRFHDLRHLAGTLTAQTGATLKEIMDRLGHSSPAAALRYQHVVESRRRTIADRLDQIVSADPYGVAELE